MEFSLLELSDKNLLFVFDIKKLTLLALRLLNSKIHLCMKVHFKNIVYSIQSK